MDKRDTPGNTDPDRRRFLGAAGAAIVGAGARQLRMSGQATGPPGSWSKHFGPVRQINAGVLNVGYVEAGPASGPAVILMHGFPYDIHSYVDVAPLLGPTGTV